MTDEKLIELAQEASSEVRDYDFWAECETCNRTGSVDGEDCPDCDGTGWIEI